MIKVNEKIQAFINLLFRILFQRDLQIYENLKIYLTFEMDR